MSPSNESLVIARFMCDRLVGVKQLQDLGPAATVLTEFLAARDADREAWRGFTSNVPVVRRGQSGQDLDRIARLTALEVCGHKSEADLRYWSGVVEDRRVTRAAEIIKIALESVGRSITEAERGGVES
jgi:hypothetical protein